MRHIVLRVVPEPGCHLWVLERAPRVPQPIRGKQSSTRTASPGEGAAALRAKWKWGRGAEQAPSLQPALPRTFRGHVCFGAEPGLQSVVPRRLSSGGQFWMSDHPARESSQVKHFQPLLVGEG